MIGRTIQIFLPDGNPRSIRIAEITSRTIQAIQIPRNKIKDASERDEANNVGIYFLFGEETDKAKQIAYIGEAENCYQRLVQHNRSSKKDFWNTAIIMTSKTNYFNKAHGKYLEWYCIEFAKKVNRYELDQVSPKKPNVSEPIEADLTDNIEAIRILLSTLGFPILEAVQKSKSTKDIFYCKRTKYSGQGEYIDDGFIVFKGSKAKIKESHAAPNWIINIRKELIKSGVLKIEGDYLIFQEDHIFNSPSGAAAAIFGIQANGWTEWKNKQGKTLDELKRK